MCVCDAIIMWYSCWHFSFMFIFRKFKFCWVCLFFLLFYYLTQPIASLTLMFGNQLEKRRRIVCISVTNKTLKILYLLSIYFFLMVFNLNVRIEKNRFMYLGAIFLMPNYFQMSRQKNKPQNQSFVCSKGRGYGGEIKCDLKQQQFWWATNIQSIDFNKKFFFQISVWFVSSSFINNIARTIHI